MSIHVKATVITATGERVRLDGVCARRSDMDTLIDRTYPDARRVSVIVVRKGQPC